MVASQLITIMACEALEPNEVGALISAFRDNLDVASYPNRFESIQTRFKGFICRHPECMAIAVPLRRAMVVFVICHELAHILAGHHLMAADSNPAAEREADRIAADLYRQVVLAGLEAHPVSIHPKLVGAPILMMHCFDLIAKRRRQRDGAAKHTSTHPPGAERAAALATALEEIEDLAGL